MRQIVISLLIVLLLGSAAAALEIPKATGYINDQAGIISPEVKLKLEQFLKKFDQSDSTQISVLTIPSLKGESLEDYSQRVFQKWGLGQKGKDNGVLLLVAKADKKIRIEVGYGLEGRLTDLLSGRIIDNEISPRFKQGDFDGGIVNGVASIAQAVRGEYTGTGKTKTKKKSSPFGFIFILFFLLPLLGRIGGRRGGRRHGGIFLAGPFIGGGGFGGGGGGFGGFGGGGGGGGGASGGW